MSVLASTLRSVLKDTSIRQFANDCSVSHSTVIMILNGRRCSLENLRSFVKYFEKDLNAQRAVVVAHLRDEAKATGVDMSKIYISEATGRVVDEMDFSPEMNADIGIIARGAFDHAEVREMVSSLADLIMRIDAHIADSMSLPMVAEDGPANPVADIDAVEAKAKRTKANAKARAAGNS